MTPINLHLSVPAFVVRLLCPPTPSAEVSEEEVLCGTQKRTRLTGHLVLCETCQVDGSGFLYHTLCWVNLHLVAITTYPFTSWATVRATDELHYVEADEEDLFMVCDLLAGGDLRYHLQQQVRRQYLEVNIDYRMIH